MPLLTGYGGSLSVRNLSSGWVDYADGTYTSGSPLAISGNTDTKLPNDGATVRSDYLPAGIANFYDSGTGKVLGNTGRSMLFTLDFKCTPTNAGTTYIEDWIDIGSPVGEIYRRISSFPKGNGVERSIVHSTAMYTLDTWETNGGDVYVRANGTADIYDIRFVFFLLSEPA